ncbi:MAG: thioredoxin TrxC [Thiogranum sp.]|jgi:thioredoxin 2
MSQSRHLVCPHCDAVNRIPAEKLSANPRCGRCKEPLFTGSPVELSDRNFDKHLKRNDVPLVVDFWAPWCGPCKMMAPHFKSVTAQMEPRVRFAKLNTEQAQRTAAQYNIRSIPTVAIFRNGREVARQAGALDARRLTQWLQSQLHDI